MTKEELETRVIKLEEELLEASKSIRDIAALQLKVIKDLNKLKCVSDDDSQTPPLLQDIKY